MKKFTNIQNIHDLVNIAKVFNFKKVAFDVGRMTQYMLIKACIFTFWSFNKRESCCSKLKSNDENEDS